MDDTNWGMYTYIMITRRISKEFTEFVKQPSSRPLYIHSNIQPNKGCQLSLTFEEGETVLLCLILQSLAFFPFSCFFFLFYIVENQCLVVSRTEGDLHIHVYVHTQRQSFSLLAPCESLRGYTLGMLGHVRTNAYTVSTIRKYFSETHEYRLQHTYRHGLC